MEKKDSSFEDAMAKVTARAWADPEYKARLMRDPASVIAEAGHPLTGREVYAHENTPTEFHFVLPPKPEDISEPITEEHARTAPYTIHEVEL